MKEEEKKETLRGFKVSHQILCITGINFEDRSFVGYVELTVWPAIPDLTEIRISSKQCTIYRVNIDNKKDAEFTYFDPTQNIGQSDPVKRSLDYFQKCNKTYLNSVDPDHGNGELIIKLPEEVLPTVAALGSLQVCVEFSVRQPQGGVHFVVPDVPGSLADKGAHMFTYALENSSRLWFPSVDSFSAPCTWKLEVTVDQDMTAVACGDLVSVESSESGLEKTFHYYLSTPVAAPNIALAVGPFEILVDPKMHEVTHFCLPGLMPVLKHTTSYIHQAFEFYEELMSSRYPYSYYKQVFVDMAYCDVATYSTMSILSTNLLHPPNVIEQTMVSRQLMAAAVAQQFFGSFIAMETWCDAWLTKGITGYLSYLFTKRTFGNNEYRNWVRKDLQDVCQYERDVGPVVLDPSKHEEQTGGATFHLRSPHTVSPRYADMLAKKARLIVRMLEIRIGTELLLQVLNKLLSLAYNASQAPFGFSSWTNMLLSTSSFLKIIYTVTGKDIQPFIDLWVYQGGCAQFTGSFVFNRKRNVVELDIRQDLTAPGALKFVGTLNVTIQELDGSFNHQFKIEENKTKFEITCHSKSRRNKKKKIPLMTGEEVDMDLTAMDADSPVLWLRLDPDLQLVRTVRFEQPDYMWQYQLKFERCIVAQFEAIEALEKFSTPASRYALNDTIENEECYYRVRQEACFCLAKIANMMTGSWTGPPAMMTIFRKMFGSHSCPGIVRQNNFSNFNHYYLLKTMPQAMARLRDTHNLCLADITKFLLDLFKYNDNSRNKWSDNYYRAALVDALAATITPAITNVSLIIGQEVTAESLSSDMRLVLEEIVRCLNLEKLLPSYRFTITVSCLQAIRTLQKFGHLPNESDVFRDYAQPGMFRDVREAAVTCLVDFIKGDLSGEHLTWVLDLIENDADPFVRHHAVTCLVENPPFRSSERSALNVESLVERLWTMMRQTSCDSRLRCGLANLYHTLYGKQRPTCLPEPQTVKMVHQEKQQGAEVSKDPEASCPAETSPAPGTASAMWNQELSSIFAPDLEEATPAVAATEEAVVVDFPANTVKVDLDSSAVDESMDTTPVDLTMIQGETTVALEESVVTEPTTLVEDDDLDSEVKLEPPADDLAEKEGKEEAVSHPESPSHLSEDSLSPRPSPGKASPDDVVISLDNLINSRAELPQDVFDTAHDADLPPLTPSQQQQGNGSQHSSPERPTPDTELDPEPASSPHSPVPDEVKASPAQEVDVVTASPAAQPGRRRRSLRSSVDLSSPPKKEETASVSSRATERRRSLRSSVDLSSPPLKEAEPSPPVLERRSLRSSVDVSSQPDKETETATPTHGRRSLRSSVELSPPPQKTKTEASPRRLSISPSRLSELGDEGEEEEDGAGTVVEEIILDEAEVDPPPPSPSLDARPSSPATSPSWDAPPPKTTTTVDIASTDTLAKTSPASPPTMSPQQQQQTSAPPSPSLQQQQQEMSAPPSPSLQQQQQTSAPPSPLPPQQQQQTSTPPSPSLQQQQQQHSAPSSPPPHSPTALVPVGEGYPPPVDPTDESFSPPPQPALSPAASHTIPPASSPSPPPADRPELTEPPPEPGLVSTPPPHLSPPKLTPQSAPPSPPAPEPARSPAQQEEERREAQPGLAQPSASTDRPLTLKRKLTILPPTKGDEEVSLEPEPKRVVPPIILSSTTAEVAPGGSSLPSLKTTFKLNAAALASSEREHHHHHKSKKKKKKNKHKHKHKHRRDRHDDGDDNNASREETPGEPRQRERLVLDMSARSRMVVSEEEGSSD